MSETWTNTGRVQTVLLFKVCAVALLAWIGWFPAMWTKLSIIIPAYVVRTAIMDSAFPLQKSILMDYVPKVRSMLGYFTVLATLLCAAGSSSS